MKFLKSNLFHFKVNTKRERRSSNNKNQNNNISKQPQTESYSTIGALVTGLTSTQANMSNDTNQSDTLIIKPTSIEINNQTNGVLHENINHSPSKSLKLKIGNETEHENLLTTNGYHNVQTNSNDHIYETPSNIDNNLLLSLETPTISSSDEPGNKSIQNSHLTSINSYKEHHTNNDLDNGLVSEMTNPTTNNGIELEKVNLDDALNSTNTITSSSILSAARLLEINQPREPSPTSGVIIPEEKRVTDRVKVFEAVANNDQSIHKKQTMKNGNQKKTSSSTNFSINDIKQNNKREQQISPSSSSTTESLDIQSTNDLKSLSITTKNKSKRPSLKKQIQNLLKIDKTSVQDDSVIIEEQLSISNPNKKSNTLNSTRNNKRDNDLSTTLKRSSPSSSQQHSPTNVNDTFKKRSSPPLTTTTTKRISPRESPTKSQQNSPIPNVTEFNMKPIAVEPLQINIESNLTKKKTPSPTNKISTNGLLTSEIEQRRSSTGVSKLIHTFQGNSSHELEQTVLVPRLRSPAQSINYSESAKKGVGGNNNNNDDDDNDDNEDDDDGGDDIA
ncbi:unnamed protein product [Rotaria sp. Silwood2]|nr:unnamed protein product [Rotaria sp. Silwood2]